MKKSFKLIEKFSREKKFGKMWNIIRRSKNGPQGNYGHFGTIF